MNKTKWMVILSGAWVLVTMFSQADTYYNTRTKQEVGILPSKVFSDVGIVVNPKAHQLEHQGWIMTPIVPFTCPADSDKIPDTRRIEVTNGVPYEVWDTITKADKAAIHIAKEAQRQLDKPLVLKEAENALISWIRANVPGAGAIVKIPADGEQKLRTKLKSIVNPTTRAEAITDVQGLIEDITLVNGTFLDSTWHDDI